MKGKSEVNEDVKPLADQSADHKSESVNSKSEVLKKIVGKIWRAMPNYLRVKIIRGSQAKFTVSVGAVVLNEEGRVLLLDHVLRPASGWGIPGGFINRGEQPHEALKREIFEETGLEIENVEMVWIRTLYRHIEIIFRAGASGTPQVKSREINRLGWFSLDEMPEQMSKSQAEIIKKVLSKGRN
jgi:8-oxo-dGTP diphosphatase